jgi:hypothetical protein
MIGGPGFGVAVFARDGWRILLVAAILVGMGVAIGAWLW